MNAVILVGGEGTRLRPLTSNTPKAMVPVLNRPFLEHILCHLQSHGVETVVLALGHLSQSVLDYFGDGSRVGLKLVYSVEKQPLGTAGPIKLAQRYLAERFLVLNGDVFSDFNITAIVDFHVRNRAIATLALTPVDNPTIYGVVETGLNGRVQRFLEKPKSEEVTSNMINAGLYVLEPQVLDYIPAESRVMFEHDVFPKLLSGGRPMFGYNQRGYWIDIGTPQKYLQLNLDLMKGDVATGLAASVVTAAKDPSIPRRARVSGTVVIGECCEIGANAEIQGPAVIGPWCKIADGAKVKESVLWSGNRLERNCCVERSVIANDCEIGPEAQVTDAVVSDHVVVSAGANVNPGTKLWPNTRHEAV